MAGTSNQSNSLFGSGGATNQSNLFGQTGVTGLSGSVFGNTGGSSNQQTGMTGSTATGQSGLFGTNVSQSAAGNTGLFGVKPELKSGLFGSGSLTAMSGAFGSEPQVQNNGGAISANHTSNSSLVILSGYFTRHLKRARLLLYIFSQGYKWMPASGNLTKCFCGGWGGVT